MIVNPSKTGATKSPVMSESCIEWIDDPNNSKHRPHHIFRCILNGNGWHDLHALAKENGHHEGTLLEQFHQTPIGKYMPAFYCVVSCEGAPKGFVIQEDLNAPFTHPCTIDFKIGTRQWDLHASEKYRVGLIEKCNVSTSHSLGVRLVSAAIFDKDGKKVESSTKSENLRLSERDL